MPRSARIDYPGAFQHVMVRGINKYFIFSDHADKMELLKRLKILLRLEGYPICYAWSIMGNHFHLLLKTQQIPLGKFMSRLLTGYANYYIKKYQWTGHVFQNRYKSILCRDDIYLKELIRYIHLNPVKADEVELNDLDKHYWTGHKSVILNHQDGVINRDKMLELFGQSQLISVASYKKFITSDKKQLRKEYNLMIDIKNFELMIESHNKSLESQEIDTRQIQSMNDLVQKISQHYNITLEEIKTKKTKEVNHARAKLFYVGKSLLNYPIIEIAQALRISKSSASKLYKKGKILAISQ